MIYLNIGSNLHSKFGNRLDNINKSIILLSNLDINIIKISSIYETPSYPDESNPKFLNICIKINTNLTAELLLFKVKLIENEIGRIKKIDNEPRVCDIDIIDFKGFSYKNNKLNLPHPRLHLRNFVLYPLREINPNWIHPISKQNVDNLINQLSLQSRKEITRIDKSAIIKP